MAINRKRKQNMYYSSGNVAYHQEYAYEQPAYAPDKYKPNEKPNKAPKQRPSSRAAIKQREKAQKREHLIGKLKLFASISVVFAGTIILMISYAEVSEMRYRISNLKEERSQLESQNVALEAEITEQISLSYVETEATTRLGMSEPQSYQIVYIDVPKENYTVQYDNNVEQDEDMSLIDYIMGLIKKD